MSIKLSIVIPTYNRRAVLERTLPAVLAQDFPPDRWEVVIVVDGSNDGTIEYVRALQPRCGFTIITQSNRGQAAARNAGVRAAGGELILLMDDDHICSGTLVSRHITAHENRGACVVFGHVFVAAESPDTLATDWVRASAQTQGGLMDRQKGPGSEFEVWVYANCSLPRNLFLTFGGYDETLYRAAEDDDLAIRLWTAGVPFHFEPTIITSQFYAKTSAELVSADGPLYGRGEVLLSRKHTRRRTCSPLVSLLKPTPAARLISWSCCSAPVSPEVLLRLPCWVAEKLISIPAARHIGGVLLERRIEIEMLRGAVREAGSWRNLKDEFGMTLPVLLYHHVGAPRAGCNPRLTVSPQDFEKQMRWLADHGYAGIRPADWIAWCREGKPLPEKPVLITFDDGYADIAEQALPVVRRYGFGAAVYVVTGQLGGSSAWDEKWGFASHPLMTREQIRYWAERGIDFGAHSCTHPDLTTLEDDALGAEIRGSADELTRILGRRPASFAYPYGIRDGRVSARVGENFDLALTCEPGRNSLATNLNELRRAEILPDDTLLNFAWTLKHNASGLTNILPDLRIRSRAQQLMRKMCATAGF